MTPTKLQILPLHTHTVYSVLDGASTIDEYIKWCKDNGAIALGISDHGWMIGASELYQKCKGSGLIGLPGCEFYVLPEAGYQFKDKPYSYYHVTAWAVNEKGYRNLLRLGSMSFGDDHLLQWHYDKEQKKQVFGLKPRVVVKVGQPKPRITFDELLQYNEGLVLGSGCLIGSINKALLCGEEAGAEFNLLKLLEVYRGRLYVELMPHACTHDYHRASKAFVHNECTPFSPDGDLQKACNLKNIEIAGKHGLPLLMTTDSHFVYPNQKSTQDCLLQNGDPSGWRFYNSYYALSTNEAWAHWEKHYGGDEAQRILFAGAVENNYAIADLAKELSIPNTFHQPLVDVGPEIQSMNSDRSTQLKLLLIRKINEHGRMKWDDLEWEKRLQKELAIICDNGIFDFANYFLFLEHWGQWARANSILSAPGRGSGAGSLLCYLLKITHLNPFEYNLPFERFLSMGRLKRGKFPDIDWDLSQRDLLTAKLIETYGDRFAQCSTHGTLKIKSALKDACRVLLGLNSQDPEINDLTKTIPMTPTGVADEDFLLGYTDAEGNEHKGHLDQNTALKKFMDKHPAVYDMVIKLLGIPRSVGRHASAFFISDRPIWETVPTCNISGYTCTQYTAAPCETAGLVKFDFLRVNTLQDIASCIRLVQQRLGHKVWRETITFNNESFEVWQGDVPLEVLPMADGRLLDIYNLPLDEAVFRDFDLGKTETVFQMNTPLLTAFCKRVRPRSIRDLSAVVALVRPGPLTACIEDGETTMTEAFIRRRHGEIPTTYAHPDLKPILSDTHGVAVYQEDLQRIFSDIAGYSPEEADAIRELIAKKKKQEMEKAIPEIRNRLREKGWNEKQIQMLVDLCIASASYSFNKAHSASYAVVAYQCQFLKHHYPLEWWTSVLQNAKVDDIREKGYAHAIKDVLQLPHINGPMTTFELRDDGKVHAPLYLIDGIGKASCQAIQTERDRAGAFTSFQDFFDRVDKEAVDLGVFHAMILVGCFNNVETAPSVRGLLEHYHYCRRVREIKIGKHKTGPALLQAIVDYKATHEPLDVPELYTDDIELEIKRSALMPIYRTDVHDRFRETLQKKRFLYDASGKVTLWNQEDGTVRVLRRMQDIQSFVAQSNIPRCGWVGLVQKAEEFKYKDKKTNQQVTALKMQVTNDGDALECIMWPNTYEAIGMPETNKIIYVKGIMKESREPGKWTLFTDKIMPI